METVCGGDFWLSIADRLEGIGVLGMKAIDSAAAGTKLSL